MMQPLPASRKDLWVPGASKATAISVESTPEHNNDSFTTANSNTSSWASFNQQVKPLDSRYVAPIRKPTGLLNDYPVMTGSSSRGGAQATYYGGEYLDPNQTKEGLKKLFESVNNDAPSGRTRRRKKLEDAAAEVAQEKAKSEQLEGRLEEEVEEDGSVDGLNVTLLPHQIRGVDFLLHREEGNFRGGLLADDVS